MKKLFLRTIVILLLCLLLLTSTFALNGTNEIALANSQTVLSLVIRNITPTIKPSDTIEIQIFISGHGIPSKNKLNTFWSSPHIIDEEKPGTIQLGGGDPIGIDPVGNITVLPRFLFSTSAIAKPPPEYGFPLIASETSLFGNYLIRLKLNTSKTAPPGDYDITFIFTYGDELNTYQDYKTTSFHISSWWKRVQLWFQIAAISVALISLVMAAVFNWRMYRRKRC